MNFHIDKYLWKEYFMKKPVFGIKSDVRNK